MQKTDLARAARARGAGAAVPPELLDTLPSLEPLNIGPRELKASRYGLAYAAPGYWEEDPLASQLEGLSAWCQEKVHFSRRKKPVQFITYAGIEQNVFQVLGFCYTYGKASGCWWQGGGLVAAGLRASCCQPACRAHMP